MIFLFPRWDMLIPWRVDLNSCEKSSGMTGALEKTIAAIAHKNTPFFEIDSRFWCLEYGGFFLFSAHGKKLKNAGQVNQKW